MRWNSIATIVMTMVAGQLWAADYYVATNGLLTNPGTQQQPFLRIQQAADIMQAGDTCHVRAGTYREWVRPVRGGNSETARITYKAYAGEWPVIKGSERITNWVAEGENVWRADVPNAVFGPDNPYILKIGTDKHVTASGARFKTRWLQGGKNFHLGDVYLDGVAYGEKCVQAEIANAPGSWFTQQTGAVTRIWANFGGANPNTACAEILVRESVFAPDAAGLNYITVDGLNLQQAACGWAEPSHYQPALMRPKGGHHWIIQNCRIADAKCVGISGAVYRDISRAVNDDTSADLSVLGRHIVRSNTIERCGEAGICGMDGWSGSVIENNLIQDINYRTQVSGEEPAGIKIHLSVDTLIKNNIIRRVRAAHGIWLDNGNQGMRITGNVISDIAGHAIYLEINHGPICIDNNIIIGRPIIGSSERVVIAHNLFVNSGIGPSVAKHAGRGDVLGYYYPHTKKVVGKGFVSPDMGGRYHNNLFIGDKPGKPIAKPFSTNDCRVDYNVYYRGLGKLAGYDAHGLTSSFQPNFTLVDDANGVTAGFDADDAPRKVNAPKLTYDFIGIYTFPGGTRQGIEDRDGHPISIVADLFGSPRNPDEPPLAGPFASLATGRNTFRIIAGDGRGGTGTTARPATDLSDKPQWRFRD